jgi:hypothetical protein
MTDEEFDSIGPAEVRARIATNVYLGATRALALAWLARRNEASSAEQLELARSAKDAAWAAARAADLANNKATIAIVIAAISIIATTVGIVIPYFLKP